MDAFPGRTFGGTVTVSSSLPDSAARFRSDDNVYRTTVVLDGENADGALRPGMSATVEIPVAVLRDVLAVPLNAVHRRDGWTYVWRLGPEGPEEVAVELGRFSAEAVELRSGLQDGDEILLGAPGSGG